MSAPYRLMGVLNVTPDSFSDGGRFLDAPSAVAHALSLAREGADIVDIGGESTRPGAEPVSAEQELRRVMPVLEGIAAAGLAAGAPGADGAHDGAGAPAVHDNAGAPAAAEGGGAHAPAPRADDAAPAAVISIDTSKASVARAAIEAGALIVNDVSALRADPAMVGLVAETGAQCCLMHMPDWQPGARREPCYEDVVDDVKAFLERRLRFAIEEGVREEQVLLDPGIGFGKTIAHNLALLRRLDELAAIGRPLVVGTSRKAFIGRLLAAQTGAQQPAEIANRLPGTIATNVLALERGASIFRVHDVAPVRAALAIAAATLNSRWTPSAAKSPTS